jgi:hypothetical protein
MLLARAEARFLLPQKARTLPMIETDSAQRFASLDFKTRCIAFECPAR